MTGQTPVGLAGRDLVVVGASAGGVEALQRLVAALPADLPATILVVLHVPSGRLSVLPAILQRSGRLPASHAVDGAPLELGQIYVAPPNLHLLVGEAAMHVIRGPKENGHRPAIDPLFRSAALAHGKSVVGVILSGTMDDGAAGLGEVKVAGGLAIVQEPTDARYPAMPLSAIAHSRPDHVLPVDEISSMLAGMPGDSRPSPLGAKSTSRSNAHMSDRGTEAPPESTTDDNEQRGELTRFSCPECGGSLWELREGHVTKLRCRVGHAYTEEAMLSEQADSLEAALWTAVTSLQEKADFCRRLAERFRRRGNEGLAHRYDEQAENAVEQSSRVRQAVLSLLRPPEEERAIS